MRRRTDAKNHGDNICTCTKACSWPRAVHGRLQCLYPEFKGQKRLSKSLKKHSKSWHTPKNGKRAATWHSRHIQNARSTVRVIQLRTSQMPPLAPAIDESLLNELQHRRIVQLHHRCIWSSEAAEPRMPPNNGTRHKMQAETDESSQRDIRVTSRDRLLARVWICKWTSENADPASSMVGQAKNLQCTALRVLHDWKDAEAQAHSN